MQAKTNDNNKNLGK